MSASLALYTLGAAATAAALPALRRRIELSRAKHRSLAGHSRLSRRVARLVPFYEFDDNGYFAADGAPIAIERQRQLAFTRLSLLFGERFTQTRALTQQAAEGLSDLQFTSRYRVPFPFSRKVREHLSAGQFLSSAQGTRLVDLDGNEFIDLTGSYGVNVFGVDFYRTCLAEAARRAEPLGPVLAGYHPAVADNVRRLREISGLDEVSFHMSGTEAVMQAVRVARYHTGRTHLVRFCGAYHGWWDDVQPGVGNPTSVDHTYTLRDMDPRSLRVLRRRRDIACVLINPLQALHPNSNAPGDSSLVNSRRRAGFDRQAYTAWLQELRQVCTERGIALIFDEVFMGFRLAPGGAQEYFGVKADLVTYGKTLGGGLPVGVVCGRADLMKRWRDDRPADICFARGTFNAHPYVMTAMQVFLERLATPEIQAHYQDLDETWNRRAARLNQLLQALGLPVRVANLSTVWTVFYTQPSRYNWMLQFYLREQGLALSWVGTGRLIFPLSFSEAEFDETCRRFIDAAEAMRADGWWWRDETLTDQSIGRSMLREMLAHRF
ncbi:MAG: aminotransferase class III-fold pyridoxal phosphate-dependent enzyme [Burkholderiales bacterium]